MIVYVASVMTEFDDSYIYVYSSEPTRTQVVERVWRDEDGRLPLSWYEDHIIVVDIFPEEVLDF